MHNLTITNGDLVLSRIGSSTQLAQVDRKAKLIQDLNLWLLEYYGIGYSTPSFGSILESFIGQYDPPILLPMVQQEIQRVLSLYQTYQSNLLKQAQSRNALANWSKDQVIQSITAVTATSQGTQISATIMITTLAGSKFPINLQLSATGLSIA